MSPELKEAPQPKFRCLSLAVLIVTGLAGAVVGLIAAIRSVAS